MIYFHAAQPGALIQKPARCGETVAVRAATFGAFDNRVYLQSHIDSKNTELSLVYCINIFGFVYILIRKLSCMIQGL